MNVYETPIHMYVCYAQYTHIHVYICASQILHTYIYAYVYIHVQIC